MSDPTTTTTTTLPELAKLAIAFRDERDWKQFHNPKDMALSLVLESAELLELMQWKNGPELKEHLARNREKLAEELSDVLFWVLAMSHDHGIDLGEAFKQKLIENAKKYPVEKAKGVSTKYTEL
jgi:NTP pyrophosphatase (non-canonical NTP hydrolase)